MKYKSIVLSGPVAAGTTTAAKSLAAKLNLEYKSTGEFFREYHLKYNIPLAAREQIPDEVDREVDEEFTKMAQEKDGLVIDSLYAGYFTKSMPHVLKVLLTADQNTRIQRAISRTHTHKENAQDVKKRDKANDTKFRKLYEDENFLDKKFFDLAIDNTNMGAGEVVEKIVDRFVGK